MVASGLTTLVNCSSFDPLWVPNNKGLVPEKSGLDKYLHKHACTYARTYTYTRASMRRITLRNIYTVSGILYSETMYPHSTLPSAFNNKQMRKRLKRYRLCVRCSVTDSFLK